MKYYKLLASILAFLLFFSVSIFAQEGEEMTVEEWEAEMNQLNQRKAELTQEVATLQGEVNNLKAQLASMKTVEDAMNELYALVDATKQDVDAYRNKVNEVESKINKKLEPKSDRVAELDGLKKSKISALPEFFDKVHNQLQRKLDAWQEVAETTTYNVVRGDCLWNIAKKKTIYDNAFAWPKIYGANRDQIKNPDLIYPKQIFKIPNLTEEEKAKYDKIRKNYKPAPPSQN